MKKRLTMFLAAMFLCMGAALAQTKVSGTVLSQDDGQPIIGAAVKVVGTSTGMLTDVNGRFNITMPANSKQLEISYLGYLSQTVAAKNGMRVFLKADAKTLDEVVVTAMGISRDKKALGYAAQELKAEDLNVNGTTSLASAIQGKLTGVSVRQSSGAPGASAQIVIRGARSFDGNNAPLYVVDGMPIASTPDFSTGNSVTGADFTNRSIDINPDDIENISVLKGQAASALYGIRAMYMLRVAARLLTTPTLLLHGVRRSASCLTILVTVATFRTIILQMVCTRVSTTTRSMPLQVWMDGLLLRLMTT